MKEIDGDGSITSVAFSSDGKSLASAAHLKYPIVLWDIATGERLAELSGHESNARSLEFSRDGKVLVSGGGEGAIRVWDLSTRREIREPMGAGGSVVKVALSPDGKMVASSAHLTATLLLWDLQGSSQPVELDTRGSSGAPSSAFSRRREDARAYIGQGESQHRTLGYCEWQTTQHARGPRDDHEYGVHTRWKAALTGHSYGKIALWDVDVEGWPRRACEIANRNFTHDDWKAFVGKDLPYRAVCPELPVPKD